MNFIELLISMGLLDEDAAAALAAVIDVDDLSTVDDEALAEALASLDALVDAVLDDAADDARDEHLAALEGIREALGSLNGEAGARDEAAEAKRTRLAELAAELRPESDDTEEPVAVEDTADEASDDDDDDDGGEPEASVADEGTDPEGAEVDDLEPVAAAAAPVVSRVNARRPTRFAPKPAAKSVFEASDNVADWGLVASANAGEMSNRRITSEGELADAFMEAWRAAEAYTGPTQTVRLFRAGPGYDGVESFYGPNRFLGSDEVSNMSKIRKEQVRRQGEFRALVASGGNPAPEENRYDIPVVGSEERPIRDEFCARFGASRGGVRVIEPPRLADLDAATSVHTNANDAASASKSFATVTAGAETTQLVSAIVKRLRFGEFQERFLPELIASWVKLAAVSHARQAETALLTSIAASDVNVSAGDDILSATRDVLAQLDRLAMAVRSRERLGRDFVFQALMPDWVYNLVRTDLSRQSPGGGTVNDETLAVADATIDRFFATRGIRPVWTPDLQQFGEQGVGTIQGFPESVTAHFCAPGAHIFLDGGMLNLGVVRDSTLNDTNDVEMFAETFEEHIEHHQVPSYQVTMDVDPSGTTSAAAAFDPSVTGS